VIVWILALRIAQIVEPNLMWGRLFVQLAAHDVNGRRRLPLAQHRRRRSFNLFNPRRLRNLRNLRNRRTNRRYSRHTSNKVSSRSHNHQLPQKSRTRRCQSS
jgi:hypothetical protein